MKYLHKDTLFKNAFYLMLASMVIAISGMAFWMLVTRRYDATAVGLATTLLSVSGLLSLLGMAGFDATLVRFLPGASRKNVHISSSIVVVGFCSFFLSLLAVAALPATMTSLAVLRSPLVLGAFVFFTVVTALNTLTNAVFLAYKQARYILIINGLFSVCKVLLPLLIIKGSAVTIFIMAGLAQLIGLIISLWWMRKRFDFTFSLRPDREVIREVRKFSASMYVVSVFNLLPPTLLPLLILLSLNAASAAYYYMAFTIATGVYTIAYASMQSAFAEGSHDEAGLHRHIVKAARLIALLLVPTVLVIIFLSRPLMGLFGADYAAHGSGLLRLFALAAIPVAVYSALGAIFKVTKNLRAVVMMNVVYASVILGLSIWFVSAWGLNGIGIAWISGNIAACLMGLYELH